MSILSIPDIVNPRSPRSFLDPSQILSFPDSSQIFPRSFHILPRSLPDDGDKRVKSPPAPTPQKVNHLGGHYLGHSQPSPTKNRPTSRPPPTTSMATSIAPRQWPHVDGPTSMAPGLVCKPLSVQSSPVQLFDTRMRSCVVQSPPGSLFQIPPAWFGFPPRLSP